MVMLEFYVPPGIGDFSPMYSKLCNMNREIIIHPSNDSPNRLSPFLDILPKVKNGGNAAHNTFVAMENTVPSGTDLESLPDGDYFLSVNRWMEEGGKIADWVPGETTYHYEIGDKESSKALAFLSSLERDPIVGVYC